MKSPKNTNLYSRLALITSVTLVVGYFVVYGAWTGILDSEIAPSATITSTLMTKIKNNLEYLSGGLANFGFSAGNVGIGTTTPAVKLEVNGKFTAQDTIQFQGGAKIRQMVVKRGTLPNANGGPYFGFGPALPKAVLDSSKCIGFATPVGALVGTSVLVTWAGMADSVNSYFSCSNCTASTQFSFMVIEYE